MLQSRFILYCCICRYNFPSHVYRSQMSTGVELAHTHIPRVVTMVGDLLLYYCCGHDGVAVSPWRCVLYCICLWRAWRCCGVVVFWRVVVNAMSSLSCWESLPLLCCCKCHVIIVMFIVAALAFLLHCHHCCFVAALYCEGLFVNMFFSGWHVPLLMERQNRMKMYLPSISKNI